jgi:hypothetical protein
VLLPAQCHLVLEEKRKPFAMFERARLRGLLECFEAFGHAVQAKFNTSWEIPARHDSATLQPLSGSVPHLLNRIRGRGPIGVYFRR